MKINKFLLTHFSNELYDLCTGLEELKVTLPFLVYIRKEELFDQVGGSMSDLYTGLKELKAQNFSRSSEKLYNIAEKICTLTEQIFL